MHIILLLLIIPFSCPHPDGAPLRVCQSMAPFHSGGILPQDSASPYIVSPSVTELPEDQPLRLTLGSRQGLTFQGFMIQGRTSLAQDPVGVFRRIPSGTKHLGCKGDNDTVTHSNTNNKGVIEFEWVPPKGYRGDIIFNATVAQGYQTFWQGVQSPIVRIVRSTGSSPGGSKNFYSGCGFTSLCFGAPSGCENSQNCKVASKVTVQDGIYTFEMIGPKEANYVAVGLSDDNQMGDDSVMECTRNDSRVEEYMSVTHGKTAPQRLKNPKQGIKLIEFNTENGQIYCKLTRDVRTTVEGKIYDLKKQHHLLIATGKSVNPNNVGFHDISYLASPQKLTLSEPTLPKTTTQPNFTPTMESEKPVVDDPFYTGCFSTKGCFGAPDGCVQRKDCKVVVATTVKGEQYEFEIMAPRNAKYVAVGLSDDDRMGDDSVLECVDEETNGVKAYMSRTIPRPNLGVERLPKPKEGIQLIEGRASDGSIYCKVQRDVRTVVNGRTYDLVNEQYFQLVVAGPSVQENKVGYHSTAFLPAGEKRYLSDVSELGGASKILIRLHGAFMLAAWVGTASIGILLARYYRQTWVGRQICGKDLWFAWHRFFMVCTWALTTVAFVLILVELKATWSLESNPHAILGMVTTIICFLQPIGAFFRPHPGTPKRPIFNWLHWLGGNVAHILAIVTIFFAVKLNKAELPEWMDWILVGYVAFHVLIHLILSILGCISDRAAESRVTSFPMKDLGVNGRTSHSFEQNADAPKSGARRIILFIYLLVIICFVAALIVVTVMAPIEETWKKLREKMANS